MQYRARTLTGVAALLLLAACGGEEAKPAGRSLKIVSPSSGAAVKGNVVDLDMAASGITIVKADGDTSGKTGHFHVFIDREPVAPGATIPKEPGIVHSASDPIQLTGLGVGDHTLTVVLGDGNHVRLGTAASKVAVRVEGPSVDASAPASATLGQPVAVTVAVQGVSIVKADGDSSGKTGHLHLFVDRDPTAAGQAIPKEAGIIHTTETTVTVPAFTTAGEHTIWVVLGDGNHTPFSPSVLDKVLVTVQ